MAINAGLNLEDFTDLLPETVVQMVDAIGFADTERLILKIGGTRFKFGKGRLDTPRLKILMDTLGSEQTYKLLAVFGGEEVYVPRCDKALRTLRNARFFQAFQTLKQEGLSTLMSMTQLCPQFGISQRTGYQIIQAAQMPKVYQHELF